MSKPINIDKTEEKHDRIPVGLDASSSTFPDDSSPPSADYLTSGYSQSLFSSSPNTPGAWYPSNRLYRTNSTSNLSEENDDLPPLDRLNVFELLDNFALPLQLERIGQKVKQQQQKMRATSASAREKVAEEWRRRVGPEEQLDRYRKQMRNSLDRVNQRWNATKSVTAREKLSFIGGVLNIFISGYLIGAHPQYFHLWYTLQLLYFMTVRFYTYHKRGYHYFLADLCYFVNLLLLLSIWVFPNSKRLFISTFCLAFGNNAVAIAMWRNSLVFHSMDKVTSLFIHIMPCVTLHCISHLMPDAMQRDRFPAIYTIKNSAVTSPEHYRLRDMIIWATVPYAVWQLTYHFMISVRRRDSIAAGRPTSFTWLRKSYAKNFLGRAVLSLPEYLQEPAFMGIMYVYALLTMVPCPLWFWSRWASATFIMSVFTWATYNGAEYYIEVFGKRMEKELEAMKRDMQRTQHTDHENASDDGKSPSISALSESSPKQEKARLERIPPLDAGRPAIDATKGTSTALDTGNTNGVTARAA